MALGDILRIDDRTVLVLGQELDVQHRQPDVGNSMLHRSGDTLVLIDTGVTTEFRAALTRAADMVGDWTRLLVLTTHGHVDHVGNNDLADELAHARGITAEHYLPARDLPQMLDPEQYWIRSFSRIAGVVPLPAPPKLVGDAVVSMFQPFRPFAAVTRTFEQRPLEQITVGPLHLTGWSFADGAVQVLRTQGHTRGHVVVLLRDNGVLHLGDEPNGPCAIAHDADQLKLQTTFGTALTLIDQGIVHTVTDGHTFAVRDAATARAELTTMLDQAMDLQAAALRQLDGVAEIRPTEFVQQYRTTVAGLAVGGANPNEMFTGMMSVNQLLALGLQPESAAMDAPWRRPQLDNPEPPPARPSGLAVVPAAVAMLRWKAGRHDR